MKVLDIIRSKKIYQIIIMLIGLTIPFFIEKFYYNLESFSLDRYFIFAVVIEFIFLHIIIEPKKLWNFMYKYRYLIGLVAFIVVVAIGYHGSSINIYNDRIQPKSSVKDGKTIFGDNRSVRSDEWVVGTPNALSQSAKINNFNEYNYTIMGSKRRVTVYPKLPAKKISILTMPWKIGYLFLPLANAFSFSWFLQFFLLFFGFFEFLMIITKKNKKWSLIGSIILLLSPAVQWWSPTPYITCGAWAIVIIDKFMNTKDYKFKILYSLLLGWLASIYVMDLYPAWMIPYAYFFLAVFIWQLVTNKGKYKIRDLLLMVGVALIVFAGLVLPELASAREVFKLTSNTVYPGKRLETGGTGWKNILTYIISIFTPYIKFSNSSEAAQHLCFYPIPIIIGIKYVIDSFRKKKKDILLLLMLVVAVLLNVWNFVKLPTILTKLTLLNRSTPIRTTVIVGFICTVILIYCLANYSMKKSTGKYYKFVIALLVTSGTIYITHEMYPEFTTKYLIISALLIAVIGYLILLNQKNTNKYLAVLLIGISVIAGILVHPVSKGLNSIYEKPVSKKIQQIVDKDPKALWISSNSSLWISNYALANGAKVLNSTNYYPNYKLWNKLDKKRKYKKVWNRYAHIPISIIEEDTKLELIQGDLFKLLLNENDVCKLNIKYVISDTETLDTNNNFNNIYKKENLNIYKTKCHN